MKKKNEKNIPVPEEQELQQAAKDAANEAEELLEDREATGDLLERASAKSEAESERLQRFIEDLKTLIRLVRAWWAGGYREVPWRSIALAAGAILYFVNPMDLVPDMIPVVGYLDDAGVVALVMVSIQSDLEAFREWEQQQREAA